MFFISLLNFNFIAFFCGLFSAYKNYKSYQKNGIESPKGRMIKTILISFLLSVPVGALIFSLMNSDGFYILVFCIMVMDLMMIIDNKLITKNNIRIINNKKTIHLGVLLVTTICSSLLMLLVASAVPLLPGPISDAIIAFDEGRSTDLTLPIIFWSICLVVNILVIVVVSKTISNKLNKN